MVVSPPTAGGRTPDVERGRREGSRVWTVTRSLYPPGGGRVPSPTVHLPESKPRPCDLDGEWGTEVLTVRLDVKTRTQTEFPVRLP